MSIVYYAMDGYHGGKYGHMSLGAFRDILARLESRPDWKLSLDIEPVSWDELRWRDPYTYARLREMLRDTSPSARLEIVSATYAQPYAWLTDGESVIRQLRYGLAKVREHFPWLQITTYAVQEPCWTSAMPQILNSFGFTRAVLKNPSTAWAGYSAGFDADTCWWVGPDGSRIKTVPRYACEELLNTWQTESCAPGAELLRKCERSGVHHPSGMYFQDLGWPAHPYVTNPFLHGRANADRENGVRYALWSEYMDAFADAPQKEFHVTQEDFLVALPWGDQQLTHMARIVRRGENALLRSSALGAMRAVFADAAPAEALDEAARLVMLAQHHDAWICASCGEKEGNWAWISCARVQTAGELLERYDRAAMEALSGAPTPSEALGDALLLNTLGRAEERIARIPVTCAPGTAGFRAMRNGREVPCQFISERTYLDGGPNAGTLLARVCVDGAGVSTVRLEELKCEDGAPAGVSARVEGKLAFMESDLYRLRLDLSRGGAVVSLLCKEDGRELVDTTSDKPFNGYVGYSITEQRWISSADAPAEAEVVRQGALEAVLRVKGRVGTASFTQTITLQLGERAIRVAVDFDFAEKTEIGEDFSIADENALTERHRSYHDGRYKLNAYFPTAFEQRKVLKDAAFDVCESRTADTRFQRWDEIKHNILISYVDVQDGAQGLAVFCDHTTAYAHGGGDPLALTMAWGADGGYWWRHRSLTGRHSLCYAFLPHADAGETLWHEGQKLRFPLVCRQLGGLAAQEPRTLACVEHGSAELSLAEADAAGIVTLRLFEPVREEQVDLVLPEALNGDIELCELDGRVIGMAEAKRDESGRRHVSLLMPRFSLRTLRVAKAEREDR